jgi:hypothetical protein
VLKALRLAIVIPSKFQQTTSKFSVKRFTGKLAKSRRLLSECLAESRDVQFNIVGHANASDRERPVGDQTLREHGADEFVINHHWVVCRPAMCSLEPYQ